MLVLTRKKGEIIAIGDDILIMVTDIRGDAVQLGITAPRSVSVDRMETRRDKIRRGECPEVDAAGQSLLREGRDLRKKARRTF